MCGASALTRSRRRELEVHRLLGPERAVVVEGGDALGHRNEIRRSFGGHALDESNDRLFRRAVVPGRQRIGGERRGCANQHGNQGRGGLRARKCSVHVLPPKSRAAPRGVRPDYPRSNYLERGQLLAGLLTAFMTWLRLKLPGKPCIARGMGVYPRGPCQAQFSWIVAPTIGRNTKAAIPETPPGLTRGLALPVRISGPWRSCRKSSRFQPQDSYSDWPICWSSRSAARGAPRRPRAMCLRRFHQRAARARAARGGRDEEVVETKVRSARTEQNAG